MNTLVTTENNTETLDVSIVSDGSTTHVPFLENDDNMTVKKTRTKRSTEKRGIQLSVPDKLDEVCIKVLAQISNRTMSDMIREILRPYIEFTEDIVIGEGYYDPETKLFSMHPDDVVAEYTKKKDNVQYMKLMAEETKESGLKFPFVRPSRMY